MKDKSVLKRKIYKELLEWKNNKNNECLLIKGARQVGKTFLIEQFGKENYDNFIEVNFIFHPEMVQIFNGSLDIDTITTKLSAYIKDADFVPGKTLIFFDEIQVCPNARTALKSFALDNRYDVIASGSLLGLHYGQDPELKEFIPSVPVGYEKQLIMYSMDFEEFLWAMGIKPDVVNLLNSFFIKREKVPTELNMLFQDFVRQYLVVGGMPEVVATFVQTSNYGKVQDVQDKILSSYADDINRHTKGVEKLKVLNCFNSIPRQLAKENRKFQYSMVQKRGNSRQFGSSLDWLKDAGIISLCNNVAKPEFPLNAYEDSDYFKVYSNDIGLLTAMYGFEMKKAILENTLTGPAKGGIYENLIADILLKKGFQLKYFKEGETNYEVEFLITKDAKVIPVEVKSKRGSTISMDSFISKYKPDCAYKIIDGNVGFDGVKVTVPHYMALFL